MDTDNNKKTNENKSKNKSVVQKKPKIFARISKFFRDCIGEIKKIVWPTPQSTFKNMGVVFIVIVIVGFFVFLLDTGLINLLSKFMGVANS